MIEQKIDEMRAAGAFVTLSTTASDRGWRAEVGSRIQLLGTARGDSMAQALRFAASKARQRLLTDESYRCDRWREIEAACEVASR